MKLLARYFLNLYKYKSILNLIQIQYKISDSILLINIYYRNFELLASFIEFTDLIM